MVNLLPATTKSPRFGAAILILSLALPLWADDLPRLSQSDVVYLGRFRLSNDGGDNRIGYGGQALGYNPAKNSLFIGCHSWYQKLAEVAIVAPSTATAYSDLPM